MENYSQSVKEYFENGIFLNAQKKKEFYNGLLHIENQNKLFFKNKPKGKME